jgi:hypothetical protein
VGRVCAARGQLRAPCLIIVDGNAGKAIPAPHDPQVGTQQPAANHLRYDAFRSTAAGVDNDVGEVTTGS